MIQARLGVPRSGGTSSGDCALNLAIKALVRRAKLMKAGDNGLGRVAGLCSDWWPLPWRTTDQLPESLGALRLMVSATSAALSSPRKLSPST